MSSDIISLLSLESQQMSNKFIFATKDSSSDLNFLFSDILSYYLKQNYSIIIANLAQSYSHFTHLLLKCGINLRVLRDQERVAVVDVMAEAGCLINQAESEASDSFLSLISDGDSSECLKPLFESIKKSAEKISSSKPNGFVIFIDEINVLTALGVSLKAIQLFVQHLFCTELADVPVTFLFGSFTDECDVENAKVVTYLKKLADVNVQVEGLRTGYSKDTHGKVIIFTLSLTSLMCTKSLKFILLSMFYCFDFPFLCQLWCFVHYINGKLTD